MSEGWVSAGFPFKYNQVLICRLIRGTQTTILPGGRHTLKPQHPKYTVLSRRDHICRLFYISVFLKNLYSILWYYTYQNLYLHYNLINLEKLHPLPSLPVFFARFTGAMSYLWYPNLSSGLFANTFCRAARFVAPPRNPD